MIESFYNARTGAIANNYGINVLSNNISNINTVGYKTDHTTFSDTLYTNLRNPDYAGDSLQAGHGSRVNAIATNMEQGALEETGYPLHFAIHGEGFFAVEDENQNIYYKFKPKYSEIMVNHFDYCIFTISNLITFY